MIYGFNPMANSPIYLAPSSAFNISFKASVSLAVAFIIFPFLNSNLILLNVFPLYFVCVLYVIYPFKLFFTGAVATSPSGKL